MATIEPTHSAAAITTIADFQRRLKLTTFARPSAMSAASAGITGSTYPTSFDVGIEKNSVMTPIHSQNSVRSAIVVVSWNSCFKRQREISQGVQGNEVNAITAR